MKRHIGGLLGALILTLPAIGAAYSYVPTYYPTQQYATYWCEGYYLSYYPCPAYQYYPVYEYYNTYPVYDYQQVVSFSQPIYAYDFYDYYEVDYHNPYPYGYTDVYWGGYGYGPGLSLSLSFGW